MHLPFALLVGISVMERKVWLLAPLVLLPWTAMLARRIAREPAGAWLNAALGMTAKLGLAFAMLLSLGAALVQV
jgi:hypothetical protein